MDAEISSAVIDVKPISLTAAIGIVVAGIAAIGVLVWISNEDAKKLEQQRKDRKDWENRLEVWTKEENFAGRTVYKLEDGSYLSVNRDSSVYKKFDAA